MPNNKTNFLNNKSTADLPDYSDAEKAVIQLLRHVGEEPSRDGLKETPRRVAKAWREMTCGYSQSPSEILQTTFAQEEDETYRGLVALRGIEFVSMCEHHCLPFTGQAHIVYIPNESGRIVGISKLARLVDCFARRLQVQERLTTQIAVALQTHLEPRGVLVVVEAQHSCMRLRGVGKQGSTMRTSEVRGLLNTDSAIRQEAFRLIEKGHP